MKISLSWLQDFVDVADFLAKPAELADLLTRAGLEVEDVVDRRRMYDQVVVGLILEKAQHPNADRLSVCRVTTGEGVVHQIVCGARNHKEGDRVVAALPGAVLPGDFAIKKSTLRGVESGGMLCSTQELGLEGGEDGIMILPESAPIGTAFAEYAGLNDVVFELKITPNRADCLSHYGLAREIAGLLGRELRSPDPKIAPTGESTAKRIPLEVRDSTLCPRYTGRMVRGVKVGSSPDWMRRRLESVGMKSINNLVDITNYVMMELGQPLHAFDADRLRGSRLVVETAKADEAFKTLDGTDLRLRGGELLIKDGEGAVALAGVVGGENSGVSDTTANIFIESAVFSPMSVRKTSRAHGVDTDSAYRFSRGVDPAMTKLALDRATELVLSHAGGEALGDIHDTRPEVPVRETVEVGLAFVSQRLGYAAEEARFVDFMKRIGCVVEEVSPQVYRLRPPSCRFDLERDVDFVEEYARINGYDKIPEALPIFSQEPTSHDGRWKAHQRVHSVLRSQGLNQAFNYGFVSGQRAAAFLGDAATSQAAGLRRPAQTVKLRNPLNADLDEMRSTLVFGLVENVLSNWRAGNEEGALYEIGPVFFPADGGGYEEPDRLGLVQWGRSRGLWGKAATHHPIFELKGALEALLETLRLTAFSWVQPKDRGLVPSFCHRGQFAHLVVEGKTVGYVGSLHPLWLEENKIATPVVVAELDLEVLLKGPARAYRAEALSRFPGVERDLAFVMPQSLPVSDVAQALRKAGGALLRSVEVFDVFQGGNLPEGQRSVAFRLSFQDRNATLQDEQIQELQRKLIETVTANLPVSTREGVNKT